MHSCIKLILPQAPRAPTHHDTIGLGETASSLAVREEAMLLRAASGQHVGRFKVKAPGEPWRQASRLGVTVPKVIDEWLLGSCPRGMRHS